MTEDDRADRGPSGGVRGALSRVLAFLDRIETFFASALITAMLFGAFYAVFRGAVLPRAGFLPKIVFAAAVALTLAAVVRDLSRRTVGVLSVVAGLGWLAALLFVIVAGHL